jgi:hypothetical protein
MYRSQVAPGETYDKLKKCIVINIVDFERIPLEKIHTKFHILEDETVIVKEPRVEKIATLGSLKHQVI